MELRDLLKKIRNDNGLSFRELAKRVGYTGGYLNDVEKGKSVSKNLLEQYIKAFPFYEQDLLVAYANEKMPTNDKYETKKNMHSHKIKIYDFTSSGNGRVDLSVYREVEYMLLNDTYIQILNDGYAFKIKDKNMEPFFLEGDAILFLKKNLE